MSGVYHLMVSLIVVKSLLKVAQEIKNLSEDGAILKDIEDKYKITVENGIDPEYLKVLHSSLKRLPPQLIKDCGITFLGFKDLGPSKKYYPNHGQYVNNKLYINTQVFEDPSMDVDYDSGVALNKFDQTLYHELGHGWDEVSGNGKDLSLKPDWLELSKWSEEPKKGYKRIIIKEKGCPVLKGDYYYAPDAKFVRFYGKRNPWDDWADTFAYYVGKMSNFVPEEKKKYFDGKLGKYYAE